METPALAVAGTATYSDFAFRWGDYSGIGIDPHRRLDLERRRVFDVAPLRLIRPTGPPGSLTS